MPALRTAGPRAGRDQYPKEQPELRRPSMNPTLPIQAENEIISNQKN